MDNKVILINESPFIKFYYKDEELPLPNLLPSDKINDFAWSHDGKYLILAHNSPPFFISTYKCFGDKFLKMPNPMISVGTSSLCCEFSPCDTYLIVGHEKAPFLSFYKHRRELNSLHRLTNPFFMPKGAVRKIEHSNDGQYVTITQDAEPTIFTYKITGETYIKLDKDK